MRAKWPAFALLALMLLFTLLQAFAPDAAEPRARAANSSLGNGRMALLRLLEAADFPVERWTKRPGALPRKPGAVWLAQLPPSLKSGAERESASDEPLQHALAGGLSNPQHFRRFAAQGGSVIIELREQAQLARLVAEFGLFELEHLRLVSEDELRAPLSEASWLGAEKIHLATAPHLSLSGIESLPNGTVLLEDAQARVLVFELPLGRGSVVLACVDDQFDNANLAQLDHAVLAVRLAERGRHGGAIYLDESSGLGGDAPSLLELALRPRALPFSAALIAVALMALWRSLFAREIELQAPALEPMSPRTRTLARARLFQRAQRFDLLAEQLRRGIVRRVGARSGMTVAQSLAALENSQAAGEWVARAAPGGDAKHWMEVLSAPSPQTAAALERFERKLGDLEAKAGQSTAGASPRVSSHAPSTARRPLPAAPHE
jgi:hypothetical protein